MMNEERLYSKKEALEVMKKVKDYIEINPTTNTMKEGGLCAVVINLFFTPPLGLGELSLKEKSAFLFYLHSNSPPFTWLREFIYKGHYWKPGKKKPRLKWLKKHIEKLEKEIENDKSTTT